MNKKLLYFGLAAIGAAVLASVAIRHFAAPKWSPRATEKDLALAAEKLGRGNAKFVIQPMPLRTGQTVRVAIGRLDEPGTAGDEIADLTLAGLQSSPRVQPVERQVLNAVLAEAGLGLSGVVRAKDAVRAGHLVKADWFLLGTGIQLGATHSIVARMVDAQTGALIDADVVSTDHGQEAAAGQLISFVAKVRTNSVDGKPQDFLAAGSFGNQSINNRLMDFPSQLRGYLTAAYRASHVTFLEREYISVLLNETMMDLAGLTDSTGTNQAAMQSAFWLAEGTFQSYEVSGHEVELDLDVNRTFGRTAEFNLRAAEGEPIFKKVKDTIDDAMGADSSAPMWTRSTEVRYQMRAGQALAGSHAEGVLLNAHTGWNLADERDPGVVEKARNNEEEAIRAFQTAIALDPTNREAQLCLAACYCHIVIHRYTEARDIYREIIDDPAKDKWTQTAKDALRESWAYFPGDEASRWYANAANSATDPDARKFYRDQTGFDSDAKTRLFQGIQSQVNMMEGKVGSSSPNFGMVSFVGSQGGNPADNAKQLLDWLPEMQAKFPKAAPNLLASVLCAQVESNNPAVEEFKLTLSSNMNNIAHMPAPWEYLESIREAALWAAQHGHPDLALTALLELKRGDSLARTPGRSWIRDGDEGRDTVSLGLAYELAGDWKSALQAFKGFSKRPIRDYDAPDLGSTGTIIHPLNQIAKCEEKLGVPVNHDPKRFQMENGQWLKAAFAFAVDDAGVWLAVNGQLISMDFNWHTNFSVWMPDFPLAGAPTCVCVTPRKIWISNDGGGIVEFDRPSKTCRRITDKDSLSMNQVCGLCVAGDTMWIGYSGGLGCMDLGAGEAKFFTPPLKERNNRVQDPTAPPNTSVTQIAELNGAMWFMSGGQTRAYHPKEDLWSTGPLGGGCAQFTIDAAGRLVVAQSYWGETNNYLGLAVFAPADGKVAGSAVAPECLPVMQASAVAPPVGDHVWIGGFGYIAEVSLKTLTVERYAYMQADRVESIQTGGGYIWTRMQGVFTRTPMPAD